MILSVEPRDTFDVEPGRYQAVCVEVREIENKRQRGQKLLRVTWEVKVPGNHNGTVRYLVGKNYEPTLAKDSQLRNDIMSWFGHDISARQFDTATLKGREAIVTVHHIENEGWPKPYCWVERIEPPGNYDEDFHDGQAPRVCPQCVVCG